ncbi:UDP-Glycosyltransferase superfamily protein [Heracleum sosnowskyi]|uniref:UDP-Glycosyltransferase superfamily protein n=1 Tax=Heracleum sosnowskyi TaxID=360622 RepID=A0AAD8H4G4_9APIA|nr:UDP-Glycosyltransferase superfamily protein [Heracleum sosnowskyi]
MKRKCTDHLRTYNAGILKTEEIFQLSPAMPAMSTSTFVWTCFTDLATRKIIFDFFAKINESLKLTGWIVCNSSHDLDSAEFTLFPDMLPISPLSASNELGHQAGNFWAEDSACMSWLDKQPASSVIYVAFGSFTVFDKTQFQELALDLELTNKPFLWVVHPDLTDGSNEAYPEGFEDRIGCCGRMVGWSPQEKVLRHPSVACFISHCGWNSTTEGLSNGVPFLCWPYFADQLLNETYICDVWKVGLGFQKDENGIITEIKNKVELLLGDKDYMERLILLKERLVSGVRGDGRSNQNFSNFVDWMK